jgi:hypothetical protein
MKSSSRLARLFPWTSYGRATIAIARRTGRASTTTAGAWARAETQIMHGVSELLWRLEWAWVASSPEKTRTSNRQVQAIQRRRAPAPN